MATFPTEPIPRMGSKDKKKYNVLKNEFEANYLQVRKASTRSRQMFTLEYNAISNDEFDILEAFFDANIGTIFTFVHPSTSVSYQVTFSDDNLEKKYATNELCDVSINLESI